MFLKAAILGFLIAAPVGPIGILCINRALRGGWIAGFVSGLGAATADGLYGAAAQLGLVAILTAVAPLRTPLRVLGAIILVYLAVKILREPIANVRDDPDTRGLAQMYGSTLALTIVNPATIASFIAVFAAAGLSGAPVLLIASAVFAGSAAWWLALGVGVGALRTRLSDRFLVWTHRVSAAGLLAFAGAALVAPAAAATPPAVVIGIDLPMAGRDGARGIMAEHGALLAIADANARGSRYRYAGDVRDESAGGIQNPHVDKGVDNIYDAPHAVGALRAWAANPKVAGIVGPLRDNIAAAELPYARRYGFALVSGSTALADPVPPQHLFSSAPPDRTLGEALVRAVRSLHFKRVAVVDGGPPHAAAARICLAALGVPSVILSGASAASAVEGPPHRVDAVVFAGPDLINPMIFTPNVASVLLGRASRSAMAREEFYGPAALEAAGATKYRYYEVVPHERVTDAVRKRFIAAYAEAPSPDALRFYLAAQALIAAIERSPSPERHAVLREMGNRRSEAQYSFELQALSREGRMRHVRTIVSASAASTGTSAK